MSAMGRWLEVLTERTPDDVSYAGRLPYRVDEIAPHPLLAAGRCLGRAHRPLFPMLDLVREDSRAYVDEELWLDERQMREVLAELRRVRRVVRREEFVAGLDGRRYDQLWRRDDAPGKLEAWLDRIEQALQAEGGRWALLSL